MLDSRLGFSLREPVITNTSLKRWGAHIELKQKSESDLNTNIPNNTNWQTKSK